MITSNVLIQCQLLNYVLQDRVMETGAMKLGIVQLAKM